MLLNPILITRAFTNYQAISYLLHLITYFSKNQNKDRPPWSRSCEVDFLCRVSDRNKQKRHLWVWYWFKYTSLKAAVCVRISCNWFFRQVCLNKQSMWAKSSLHGLSKIRYLFTSLHVMECDIAEMCKSKYRMTFLTSAWLLLQLEQLEPEFLPFLFKQQWA